MAHMTCSCLGLFYVKANERIVELMHRLETRLSRQKYWDQTGERHDEMSSVEGRRRVNNR